MMALKYYLSETSGQLPRGTPASRWSRIKINLVSLKTFLKPSRNKKGRKISGYPTKKQSFSFGPSYFVTALGTLLHKQETGWVFWWNSSNSTISSTIKYRERQYRRGTNLALRVTQQVTFCWNYRTNSVHYHTYMGAGHTPYSVLRKVKLASLHY